MMTGAVPNTGWLERCLVLDDQGFINTGNQHHLLYKRTTLFGAWQSNGTFTVVPTALNRAHYDCVGTGSCTSTPHVLSNEISSFTIDGYGNLTNRSVSHFYGAGVRLELDTDVRNFTYNAADIASWFVSQPDPALPSTTTSTTPTVSARTIGTKVATRRSARGS